MAALPPQTQNVDSQSRSPSPLRRSIAGKGPGLMKRIRSDPTSDPESDQDPEDLPDLHGYFEDFEVPLPERVSLCRSYASYLVAVLKRNGKK